MEKIKFDFVTYRLLYSLKGELEAEKRKREASYTVEEIPDSSQFTTFNISSRLLINKPNLVKYGKEYALAKQRSRKMEDILKEVQKLKDLRYQEITLLRKNVNESIKWEANEFFNDQITDQNEVEICRSGYSGGSGGGNAQKNHKRRGNLNFNYQFTEDTAKCFEWEHSCSRTL